MKIGFDRRDALVGEGYAVSAHLAEGWAGELIKKSFPTVKNILIKESILKEEPQISGIASMLRSHGYTLVAWNGSREELISRATDDDLLITFGNAHALTVDADILSSTELAIPHFWWLTKPCEAFRLLPEGLRAPTAVFADPTLYDEAAWYDALPYAVRLGVLFDRDLFSLVYSSYDPVTLLARGCRLTGDLAREDAGNVRSRLAFGAMMSQVLDRLTDHEMTEAEVLALGMLYEVRLGASLGVSNPRKLGDVEGVLSYHGYPRALDVGGEELRDAFLALYGDRETLTLTLPTAIGKCRTAAYDVPALARLLTSLGTTEPR